jgi:hypothetical protein
MARETAESHAFRFFPSEIFEIEAVLIQKAGYSFEGLQGRILYCVLVSLKIHHGTLLKFYTNTVQSQKFHHL